MNKSIWFYLKNVSHPRHYYYVDFFESLELFRLNYGSQLRSPHLLEHIDQLEKVHRSGMQSFEYSYRLVYLKLHSLQRKLTATGWSKQS